MPVVQVNEASRSDWPFLIEMMVLTMRTLPAFASKSEIELESLAQLEASQWQPERDHAFVAWVDEQRAGAIWLHAGGEPQARQFTLGLAVAPRFRRQGLGARLLQHALEFCRANQGYVLNLKVHPSNEAAMRLYRRFGFEVTIVEMKLKLADQATSFP